MDCTIFPGSVTGSIAAPASKSYAQRAIFAAAMADGLSILENFEYCDDSWHALHNAVNLGAEINQFGKFLKIRGNFNPRSKQFYAGESGLTARILASILTLIDGLTVLRGSGSLQSRPFDPIFEVYKQLGTPFSTANNCLPLAIGKPTKMTDITIDGSLSSQFITGLLITLPKLGFRHKLNIINPKSTAYIEMTIELLKQFGVQWTAIAPSSYHLDSKMTFKGTTYNIEGDWSGAAFLIAAGLTAGSLEISNLQSDSKQADRAILNAIPAIDFDEHNTLQIHQKSYPGFEFDATDCPDLFPPLASIAAFASSRSKIKGVERLKHKESDRGIVLQEEFAKLNVKIELDQNEMIIHPSKPSGGIVDAHNDHRIAMALSILALNASDTVTINGIECVSKSYPQFFEDLQKLGVKMEMVN